MISPELIRRYPFFVGLEHKYILLLANTGEELIIDEGAYFFKEGDILEKFYLIMEGAVTIVNQVTDRSANHGLAEQLTHDFKTVDVTVSTVGSGDVFAWSAIIPPHYSSAGAKAVTKCKVIAFDCIELRKLFIEEPKFGLSITEKIAQVIRNRLRDLRIESLGFLSEKTKS